MRLLPSVKTGFKTGLLSGLSWVTVGCTGLSFDSESFNAEPSPPAAAKKVTPAPSNPRAIAESPGRQDAAVDAAPAAAQSSADALWSELRQGQGYVVMMRHALAPGTGDPPGFRLEDCSTQRNLSAAGRQQAIAIGEAFRQRRIPVNQVRSSQWCRCLDTAKLLNLGTVEPFAALNSFFSDRSTAAAQTEQVRAFIREQQNQSGVTVLVTHQVNITAISNIVPASGEFIVLRSTGTNGQTPAIEVVGRLNANPVE